MLGLFRAYLNLWPETEITLEANPGTAEAGRFKDYARNGVTRLSLGVQSFNDRALKALGRVHNAAQAKAAIDMALNAFEQVNLDIMYALPEQTLEESVQDCQTALSYQPQHLSFYHLTLEPNTYFAKYPPPLPDDDSSAIMQDKIVALTAEQGYERYAVSAYAQKNCEAIPNINYWEFGDYLGIGPGAHSKLSFPDRVIRQVRKRNPDAWLSQAPKRDGSHIAQNFEIAPDEFPFEFMLNVLRLREGVPASFYFERTGQSWTTIADTIKQLRTRG